MRILLVDDERPMLDLARHMLKATNKAWQASFATSGDAALGMMEGERFDFVVSDLRMPRMNGFQFLNEVMRSSPASHRILLSGFSDQEEIARCAGPAHQFLSKTWDLAPLKSALQRELELRAAIDSDKIVKLLSPGRSLPTIPSVYFAIMEALRDPKCSIDTVGQVVASDATLTAKSLQLVNSAFFGFGRKVSSASEATLLLGLSRIRCLALTTQFFSSFDLPIPQLGLLEQIWEHSLNVGQNARKLVEMEGGTQTGAEQAFTAGVLHDIGKVLLADSLGAPYFSLLAEAAASREPLHALELRELGVTHAQVGAYILALWGLPTELVEAVGFHHEPGRVKQRGFAPLTAVHVANAIEAAAAGKPAELDAPYLSQMGFSSRVTDWQAALTSA